MRENCRVCSGVSCVAARHRCRSGAGSPSGWCVGGARAPGAQPQGSVRSPGSLPQGPARCGEPSNMPAPADGDRGSRCFAGNHAQSGESNDLEGNCVIRPKLSTKSGRSCPLNPVQVVHSIRRNLSTESGRKLSRFSGSSGLERPVLNCFGVPGATVDAGRTNGRMLPQEKRLFQTDPPVRPLFLDFPWGSKY